MHPFPPDPCSVLIGSHFLVAFVSFFYSLMILCEEGLEIVITHIVHRHTGLSRSIDEFLILTGSSNRFRELLQGIFRQLSSGF